MTVPDRSGPEAHAQAGRGSLHRVQLVNAYVAAAIEVLVHEAGPSISRGGLELQHNPYTSEEVTAVIGVSGAVAGSFYLSMSEATAMSLVSHMLGQEAASFDHLAQSGIAELANVVAGTAGIHLAEGGLSTDLTPPLLLVGAGARLSSVEIQRLVVPLETPCGRITVHVALRDAA